MYIDEIPKELEVGNIYTKDQIRYFISDQHGRVSVISNDNNYSDGNDFNLRVISIEEGFIHKSDSVGDYLIPNKKEKIYYLERA